MYCVNSISIRVNYSNSHKKEHANIISGTGNYRNSQKIYIMLIVVVVVEVTINYITAKK